MRVLISHGYLLHGTGSNVYNASLGAALVRAGHEVQMVCQEPDPWDLDWVDAVADWDDGALSVQARRRPVRATVYRPDIGGLLPVYVPDRYEGVEARPFEELSDAELDRYLAANVAAVCDVMARARPDVALANHLVMSPLVLARALSGTGTPYAVKVHGSALEYTVKPHPRFLPHAREGIAAASAVLVGSRHTAESLWAALEDPSLPGRTRLGPPGVDVQRFGPRTPAAARAGLAELRTRLAAAGDPPPAAAASSFARNPGAAARALEGLEPALAASGGRRAPLTAYVGKLIGAKGVELLLAAWPLIVAEEPAARLVVVGFGAMRSELEAMAAALAAGDLDAVRAIRDEKGAEMPLLAAFLNGLDGARRGAYREAATRTAGTIAWTGRLDHPELADLLPAAEAQVVPSTFPEAFGMVAAEAAACGTLPVVARHSGLAEVAGALAAAVPPAARPLLSFELGPDGAAVRDLAAAVTGWLAAPPDLRAATREALVSVTRTRWSWDGVARTVIAAAEGRLDGLPHP